MQLGVRAVLRQKNCEYKDYPRYRDREYPEHEHYPDIHITKILRVHEIPGVLYLEYSILTWSICKSLPRRVCWILTLRRSYGNIQLNVITCIASYPANCLTFSVVLPIATIFPCTIYISSQVFVSFDIIVQGIKLISFDTKPVTQAHYLDLIPSSSLLLIVVDHLRHLDTQLSQHSVLL